MKLKERMRKVNMGALKITRIAAINLATGDGEMSKEDLLKLSVEYSKCMVEMMKIIEDALGELDKMEDIMEKLDNIDKGLDVIEDYMTNLEVKISQ